MDELDILKTVGLDKKEAELYLALLDLGQANIAQISKKSGIHRPIVYKILPRLEDRGIVARVLKKKRRVYIAESPEKLKQLFDVAAKTFEAALPELMNFYHPKGKRPVIKFFEGQKGIARTFEDIAATLKPDELYYRYSSITKPSGITASYIPPHYYSTMKEKRVRALVIANDALAKNEEQQAVKGRKPSHSQTWKVIPPLLDTFEHNFSEKIYGDRVSFVDYGSNTAFIIESREFANFQKSIFKQLWDKLPLSHG